MSGDNLLIAGLWGATGLELLGRGQAIGGHPDDLQHQLLTNQ